MTAVEKLLEELETLFNELHNGSLVTKKQVSIIIEEINELFEQQIKDAYNQGYRNGQKNWDIILYKDISQCSNAQNYYDKTFKK